MPLEVRKRRLRCPRCRKVYMEPTRYVGDEDEAHVRFARPWRRPCCVVREKRPRSRPWLWIGRNPIDRPSARLPRGPHRGRHVSCAESDVAGRGTSHLTGAAYGRALGHARLASPTAFQRPRHRPDGGRTERAGPAYESVPRSGPSLTHGAGLSRGRWAPCGRVCAGRGHVSSWG